MPRHSSRLAWALVLIEALLLLLDLRLGVGTELPWEEQLNARAGLQLACGHLDRLWAMQYRPFCGGCSAEALLAAPMFRLLGSSVLAWKLVPALFHLGVTGFGTALSLRAGGPRAGLGFALLVLGAPPFYRELALTGFGNHAEVMAFVLGAALLLCSGRSAGMLMAGVVAGLGLWFAWSSAWGVVALGTLGLLAFRARGLLFVLGLPVGLVPLLLHHRENPGDIGTTIDWWSQLSLAPPGAMERWLVEDFLEGGLSPWLRSGEIGAGSVAWWGGITGLGLVGALLPGKRPEMRLPLFGLGALVLAYLLRYDLWDDNPLVRSYDPFNLRYRVGLLPLLWLGAARVAGRGRWAFYVVLLLGLFGLGHRVAGWEAGRADPASVPVYPPTLDPDPSVPAGEPLQRLARGLRRPQDIEAAIVFIEGHEDRFPECRRHHLGELGRRIGLAGSPEAWRERALGLARSPEEVEALEAAWAQGSPAVQPAREKPTPR